MCWRRDDQDATLNLLDEDGDGVTSCGGDCNDLDDQIAVDTDKDGDGYLGCTEDCDDASLLISPAGKELVHDGVDQDCDGSDLEQMFR